MSPQKKSHPEAERGAEMPSLRKRRLKYALSVGVSVVAAVVIVGALNVLVVWQYDRMGPGVKGWVRYDLTSTRRHSLSEQTRVVLERLDGPVRLVVMTTGDDAARRRLMDLAEEYGRQSRWVSAERVDPVADPAGRDAVYAALHERYGDELGPLQEKLVALNAELGRLAEAVAGVSGPLRAMVADGEVDEERGQKNAVRGLIAEVARAEQQLADAREMLDEERVLPDYRGRILAARGAVGGVRTRVLRSALPGLRGIKAALKRGAGRAGGDASLGGALELVLQAESAAVPVQAIERAALQAMEGLAVPEEYAAAYRTLQRSESVVVLSEERAWVLPIGELFRGDVGDAATAAAAAQRRGSGNDEGAGAGGVEGLFWGEEKITGALVRLAIERRPRVVFVSTRGIRALPRVGSSRGGVMGSVAGRLRGMGFGVEEWQVGGGGSRAELPEAEADEAMVWVVMPLRTPTDRDPATLDPAPRLAIAELIEERLAAGDGVLTILNYDPTYSPGRLLAERAVERQNAALAGDGEEDEASGSPSAAGQSAGLTGEQEAEVGPIVEVLRAWGIGVELHKRIAQEVVRAEGQRVKSDYFEAADTEAGAAAAQATRGLWTVFSLPSPVVLDREVAATAGVALQTLVEVGVGGGAGRAWAYEVPVGAPMNRVPEFDEAGAAERFAIGATAEKADGGRLAVVAEPIWATDQVTTFGVHPELGAGPGLAERPGGRAMFGGNAELFINTVYWLAKEDGLIATSPRAGDVPRVGAMSDGELRAYRLAVLFGLPGAVLVGGGLVGWRRRRSV
ncbi:MAG: Gldg family protein [Planctomycetota bacterium]